MVADAAVNEWVVGVMEQWSDGSIYDCVDFPTALRDRRPEIELFEFFDQTLTAQSESLRRFELVATGLLQGLLDHVAFERINGCEE